MSSPRSSISPVCRPARTARPTSWSRSAMAAAQRTARPGPSKWARNPSPVDFTATPRCSATHARVMSSWRSSSRAPAGVALDGSPLGGSHDVGEQHGGQHSSIDAAGSGYDSPCERSRQSFAAATEGSSATGVPAMVGTKALNMTACRTKAAVSSSTSAWILSACAFSREQVAKDRHEGSESLRRFARVIDQQLLCELGHRP